jgi:endogenous inhibitor of DNA gyrase (YacG/DUF329 family)
VRLTCPICKKVIENAPEDLSTRPFCSPACKLIDLDNWLNERYCVSQPATPADLDDERSLN